MLLSEHATCAAAAFELATKMSIMSMPDFLAFAHKLDESQTLYPAQFCAQATLQFLRFKMTGGADFAEVRDAVTLKARQGTSQTLFKAAAPCLQHFEPLRSTEIEKVLGDGLFGTIILGMMARADGVPGAVAAAATLRDSCAAASIMALASAEPEATPGPSTTAGPGWAWIQELQDVAIALLCVASDQSTQEQLDTLVRVQESKSGVRKLFANALKKKPWSDKLRSTWQYGIGSVNIIPRINEALRACAADPAAWATAAAQIPSWKAEVRPGTTTVLEEMLWTQLLSAWDNFDALDRPGATALLARLRLARSLEAPSRPDAASIDLMESDAPRPQLCVPVQRCVPKLQNCC